MTHKTEKLIKESHDKITRIKGKEYSPTAREIENQIIKSMTETSVLTRYALAKLSSLGFEVWRQNQVPVRGRRFIGKLGLSDIQGYCTNTGRAVYCEVKSANDRLSEEQINFLNSATKSGCYTYICKHINYIPYLILWTESQS